MAREIPDACWMKVVGYLGVEQRLMKIKRRDWRFEAARAVLNKSVQGLILLCHRYAFPYISELQEVGSLDKLWSTVTIFFVSHVQKARSPAIQRRILLSELLLRFNNGKPIDRSLALD